MTTELTGRALDEACAMAMGCQWDHFPTQGGQTLPLFSTDWSRVPEMLAWLAKHAESQNDEDWFETCLCIVFSWEKSYVLLRRDPRTGGKPDEWHRVAMDRFDTSRLPEALARLVVKVAELENKETER